MIRGYARVSSREQNLDLQISALRAVGVPTSEIYTDKTTGAGLADDRPGFALLRASLVQGDSLVIWRLDRLGRALRPMLDLLAELAEDGITLVSITEAIDTRSPSGQLVMHVFAALAQFERDLLRERTAAGIAAAKAAGRRLGRRAALDPAKVTTIRELDPIEFPTARIARLFGVSRSTVTAARDGLPPYDAIVK